jgi:DNA-binding GntR family transcriptional regulator
MALDQMQTAFYDKIRSWYAFEFGRIAMSTQINRPPTLRDAVVQHLRDEIVNGVLVPGTVIKDAELAARLGFSITPVREALTQLAMEGLIEMPPNRAKRVAPLTKQSALELYEVMRLLSLPAFERGIYALTPTDIQAMQAAYASMLTAISRDDRQTASAAGRTFIDIVIRAAGNYELRRMLGMIVARFQRLVLLRYQESIVQITREKHAQILDALTHTDYPSAIAAYREQLDQFERSTEAIPDEFWD